MTRTQGIIAVLTTFLIAGTAASARGQAFTEVKTALVDYSKADIEPSKACEAMGRFTSKDIAQIAATMITADATAPAHLPVTTSPSPDLPIASPHTTPSHT